MSDALFTFEVNCIEINCCGYNRWGRASQCLEIGTFRPHVRRNWEIVHLYHLHIMMLNDLYNYICIPGFYEDLKKKTRF
jgi:hypothetical protein